MQRNAQSGANTATLLAIIAALILLYILFLPQADREKLLGDGTQTPAPGARAAPQTHILLLEKPGTLFKAEQKDIEHRIDSFNIFTRTEDKVIKSIDSISITSSKSGSSSRKFFFNIEDPENTKNAILSFDAAERSGRLTIILNKETLLNEEVKGQRILTLENLEATNEIEFATQEVPSWQFWVKNFYDIKNVKILATITDVANRDATKIFFVSDKEAGNIESASLTYFIDCATTDIGKLSVYLNGFKLSSGIPDCGTLSKHTINPANIEAGNNEVKLITEKGTYLIDRVFVKTKLKEAIKPIYYFEINQTTKREIANKTKEAVLKIKFVDDKEEKLGIVNVNGHRISFDTRTRPEYTKDISSNIEEGNNYIQIEPQVTLNIVEIRVELRQKIA